LEEKLINHRWTRINTDIFHHATGSFICVHPCLSVVENEKEKEEVGVSAPDLAD